MKQILNKYQDETKASFSKMTPIATVMVFVLSAITALFFSLVDIAIKSGLQATLNVFGS